MSRIYFINAGLFFLVSLKEILKNKLFDSKILYFVLFFNVFIFGLRREIGYDYASYKYIFSNFEKINIEYFFKKTIEIIRIFTTDPTYLFLIFYLFTICYLYKSLLAQNIRYKLTYLLLYMLMPGLFLNSLTTIRQSLSIVILFYSYSLYPQKTKQKIVLLIVAIFIHYSSFIAFLSLLFCKLFSKKIIKYRVILLFLSLVSMKINIFKIFMKIFPIEKYKPYLDSEFNLTSAVLLKLFILNIFILLLVSIALKLKEINREIVSINIFSLCLGNLTIIFSHLYRIVYYFKVFEILLVCYILEKINKKYKLLVYFIVVFYYFSQYYLALRLDATLEIEYKLTPYRHILF